MKYDILIPFRKHLYELYTENTAKKYYSAVKNLLSPFQFEQPGELPVQKLEEQLKKVRSKNEFSATKNGLYQLKAFDARLKLPSSEFFQNESKKKRNRAKIQGQEIDLSKVKRSINQMSNLRLKTAYRLAMISGLRISEIEDLKKEDIGFADDGRIMLWVAHGKGDKAGYVTCLQDPYTQERIKEILMSKEETLFYSESHMRHKAKELGFGCHDLRRIFAREYLDYLLETTEMSKEEAIAALQEELRHEKQETTMLYLGRKHIKKSKKRGKP